MSAIKKNIVDMNNQRDAYLKEMLKLKREDDRRQFEREQTRLREEQRHRDELEKKQEEERLQLEETLKQL